MHLRPFIKFSRLYLRKPGLHCDAHGATGRLIWSNSGLTQCVAPHTVSGEGHGRVIDAATPMKPPPAVL